MDLSRSALDEGQRYGITQSREQALYGQLAVVPRALSSPRRSGACVLSLGEDTARACLRQALMLGVLVGARRRLAPFLLSDAHERPTSGIYFLRPE